MLFEYFGNLYCYWIRIKDPYKCGSVSRFETLLYAYCTLGEAKWWKISYRNQADGYLRISCEKSFFIPFFRNLETFFLQKRFLIYNHKPEMILKVGSVILSTIRRFHGFGKLFYFSSSLLQSDSRPVRFRFRIFSRNGCLDSNRYL